VQKKDSDIFLWDSCCGADCSLILDSGTINTNCLIVIQPTTLCQQSSSQHNMFSLFFGMFTQLQKHILAYAVAVLGYDTV